MSDEINTSKPNVGIRGNPQNVPIYQSHESLGGAVTIPNFGNALTELASNPTMLGQVGSQIQQSASTALATRWGQSLGKEPKGNLFPAITNFDKSVTESYTQQAQVTLGNQANALFLNAQEEIAKANKLTPGLIESYKSNLKSGLQDTLDLAPDALKTQLEGQFVHQLQSSTHQYNLRMMAQQKADAESAATVWRTHQNDLVTNLVKDAKSSKDFEQAHSAYQSLLQNIQNSTLSPSEKDTAATTAKLNYHSAISIQKVMDARNKGKAEDYLASIADKKIQGLSWSESEQVRDNTVRYIGAVESAENRDENLLMSQASLDMAQGSFNESNLASLRDQLRPQHYNEVATRWAIAQKKQQTENLTLQNIVTQPGNATTYEGLSPKQINAGFDLLATAYEQKGTADGNKITRSEAEFRAASAMNTVVPKYIDRMNRQMVNGNAQQVLEGFETYSRMKELDGNKVIGINQRSLAVATMFKNYLTSNPDANPDQIQEALAKTKDAVLNKPEEVVKANESYYHKYLGQVAKNPQSRLSNALSLSGLESGKAIEDSAGFQNDIYSRMQSYMQLTNSDVQASKELVQADVAKIWGESKVNGESKIVKLGIEKGLNLPTDAAPLIQDDIIKQLIPQLESTKQLYDKGAAPSYWRIKEGRTNYNEYAKAKLTIQKEGRSDPDYATHSQLVKKYEKGEPIVIEQVHKNGVKEWHLNVQSSPYIARSAINQKVYGYNIGIKDPKSGMPGHLFGYYGNTHTIPTYSPNETEIRKNYIGVANFTGLTPQEYIQRKLHPEHDVNAENRQKVVFGRVIE